MTPDSLNEVALYVGEIGDEIDFSFPPASGQEYIQRVVIEAQKCAEIAVANIDQIRLKSPTAQINSLAGCMEAPASIYPDIDWQNCQIADFSEIRLRVGQLKNEINETKFSWKSSNTQLPNINDENSWIKFCSEYNQEDNPKNVPLMNNILRMNQPMVEQILEYLITFVEKQEQINHGLGQWLYALLVVLELPLNPDICSCLRSLARACSVIRANTVDLKTQEIAALNLFICLVARYFRQLDLADP